MRCAPAVFVAATGVAAAEFGTFGHVRWLMFAGWILALFGGVWLGWVTRGLRRPR